jgi:hypothetical protein
MLLYLAYIYKISINNNDILLSNYQYLCKLSNA